VAIVFVQFRDSSNTEIVSYFGCPQDKVAWPNQGTVDTTDQRWKTFFTSLPPVAQVTLPAPSNLN
jgi:hypothetical protein